MPKTIKENPKKKQIPLWVKLWVLLIGFWGGNLVSVALIGAYLTTRNFWVLGIWGLQFVVALGLWYLIGNKRKKQLEEWGFT